MNSRPPVLVLLSTYNGERFLEAQLQSLLEQSYEDLRILVRDDGSSDGSRGILSDWGIRYPERIQIISDESGNLGASGSFAWLVQYALEHKSELNIDKLYMMFCDQDDVWFKDKVTRQINAMLAAEDEAGTATEIPLLVHSDLEVVTEDMQSIAKSLASYQGLETDRNSFANMVISNLVTGCTALINEPLARMALPIPDKAIMHDWWFALVAAAFGRVVYLDTPLIYYRQHGANTIGAKERHKQGPRSLGFWRKLVGPAPNEHLYEVATQAGEFRNRFGKELSLTQQRQLGFCRGMGARVGFVQRFFYRVARRF